MKRDWHDALASLEIKPAGNQTLTPIRNKQPPAAFAAMLAKADAETMNSVKYIADRWGEGKITAGEAIKRLQNLGI